MKKTISLFLLSMISAIGFSQNPITKNFEDWTASTGSQNFFQKNLSKTDGSGNVYVCGATVNGSGDYDLLLAKYNSSGVQQWIQQYAGAAGGNDFATAVWIDGSSNVYVTGSTLNSSADSNDVVTIKYNSSGMQQWAEIYNGGYGNDGGSDITVDGSGNVYVSGATNTGTSTYYDGLLIKYNSSGTQQYVKTFDNNMLNDGAYRVALLTSNRVAIACVAQATSTTFKFASVRYTATTGAFIATSVSASFSIGFKMVTGCVTDAAHNMYVTGWEYNISTGFDYRTIKLDSALNQIWSVSFDGATHQDDESNGIAMDGSGNVYVTGYSTGANGKDYATVKYNSSGTQQWVEYYNDPDDSDDVANAIVIDNNGKPVVTGYNFNGSSKDYHTIKYDASGTVVWSSDFNGLANKDDRAFDISCDASNSIIVTGQTQTASLTLEYTTVKYSEHSVTYPQDTVAATSNSFIYTENRGQLLNTNGDTIPQVRYYVLKGGPQVFFTDTSVSYVFAKLDTSSASHDTLTRVDMKFMGANSGLKIRPLDVRSDYENFFLGHIPEGRSRVQNYDKLASFNVWNNVDMIYGSNLKGMKYYFICKPGGGGGAYANIDLKYQGADSVKIVSGQLIIYTKQGNIVQPKAAAWQIDGSGNYSSLGWQPSYNIVATNEVKFTGLGSYNTSLPLVIAIDWGNISVQTNSQNLMWSSFYGGGHNDAFHDLKVTTGGKQIACGATLSTNFPATNGFQTTLNGANGSAIVVDFNIDNSLDWATYFGGNTTYVPHTESTVAWGIDADKIGDVYFTGSTNTSDFPPQTWNSAYFQTSGLNGGCSCGSNLDAFVVKLSANGQTDIWSTLYGGDGDDVGYDIKFNTKTPYDFYFGGYSNSSNFPFPNTLPAWSAGTGFFVHSDLGGVPHFGSYIGAVGSGTVFGIAVDQNSDVVLVGEVGSGAGFTISEPSSGNTGNGTYGGNSIDAFITKLDHASTPSIIWSTYYGNTSQEVARDVVTNFSGPIHYYVIGDISNNAGSGLPSFFNPGSGAYYQTVQGGGTRDAFVLDADVNGNIPWATLYGGNGDDYGNSIALDASYDVFITGQTKSSDLGTASPHIFPNPNLGGGYDVTAVGGTGDLYLAGFTHGTYVPNWGTYYGGTFLEANGSIDCYQNTALYLAGYNAGSATYPLYSGPGCSGLGTPYFDNVYANPSGGSYTKASIAEFCLSQIIAGTDEQSASSIDLSIFPNPSNGTITITGQIDAQDEITIDVFDLLGQAVYEEKQSPLMAINKQVDLSSVSNGVYMVQIRTGNKSFTQKVIIQR